jgi:hypothetical protein
MEINITIYLHDNTIIKADVTNYNAAELSAQFNDQRIMMVSFGNIIVNKNSVKMIAPTAVETPAP